MKIKRFLALLLAFVMIGLVLTGCAGGTQETAAAPAAAAGDAAETDGSAPATDEVIVVRFPTYMVGLHVSAEAFSVTLNEFHEQFGDWIRIEIEEIPTDQVYLDNMKILAASGDLPDVVEGKSGLEAILERSGFMVDLLPYLEADEEWKRYIGPEAIAFNMFEGRQYFVAFTTGKVGYFYNRRLFEQVGIRPAETWEEFMDNNARLLEAGITPLSLQSGENAWTANLWLASIIGTSGQAGNQFMNTMFPRDFNTPEVIAGLEMINTMFRYYTTPDALGADYAVVANHFTHAQTAMIANGPWMIPDFLSDEKSLPNFIDDVGIAIFPGGGVIYTVQKGGYGVTNMNPYRFEAALEWVKFLTGREGQTIRFNYQRSTPLTGHIPMTDEFREENPLVADLWDKAANATWRYPWLDIINYGNVTAAFKVLYPEMVNGQITAAEMAQRLSEVAQENRES